MKTSLIFSKESAAALSTILLIGVIVTEAAIASLLASYLVSQEGLGLQLSYNATLVSRAGANDALLRVVREGSASSGRTYQVSVGSWNTDVTVEKTILGNNDSQFTITSTARALNKEHTTRAVAIVDAVSGLPQIDSIASIVP